VRVPPVAQTADLFIVERTFLVNRRIALDLSDPVAVSAETFRAILCVDDPLMNRIYLGISSGAVRAMMKTRLTYTWTRCPHPFVQFAWGVLRDEEQGLVTRSALRPS